MLDIIILLVVVGVGLYLINLIPMDATIKTVIKVVVVLLVILYVLQALGIWHGFQLRPLK